MSDSPDLAHYRALLEKRRQALLDVADTGDAAAAAVELDQTRVGRLSRMDALQGQAMSVAARQRRELELKAIAAALVRIDKHEYGECLACGEAIAAARLEIDPATRFCIHCAERHGQ
ncbi:MAG: TraR/DksA C4-type zinc finger protein [Granulosicoccaceae bacterium]|jgi:DnaK suppressor protein